MDLSNADQIFYDGPHHSVQITSFDFDAVDARLGNEAPPTRANARADAADALGEVFRWCGEGRNARAVALRFLALMAGIRPEFLNAATYRTIATEFGISKQAFSKTVLHAEARFTVKFSRTRPESGRQRMAAARRGGPDRTRG